MIDFKFVHNWNILLVDITSNALKEDKLSVIKFLQLENILSILITLLTSNLSKFNSWSEVQLLNINSIFSTLEVEK